MSHLISMAVDKDKPSSERHRAFAEYFGIKTTTYIGKKSLFDLIQSTLASGGRDIELMAWFTYRVYRKLTNAADDAAISGPDHREIQAIASTLAGDPKIVKSARRYQGTELIYFGEWTNPDGYVYSGGSKNTAAYKAAELSLRQRLNLPKNHPTQKTVKPPPKIQTPGTTPKIRTAKSSRRRSSGLRSLFRLAFWAFVAIVVVMFVKLLQG